MPLTRSPEPPLLPPAARHYLAHTGVFEHPEVTAVALTMRGTLRLGGRWRPFTATEWLAPHRGFDWRARVRLGPVPVSGFDRYRDGEGAMRWRLLGLLPLLRASGGDIDRSARGRVVGEAVWAPAALLPEHGVTWREDGDGRVHARWTIDGVADELTLEVDGTGRLLSVEVARWGDPDGTGWRLVPFGARVEAETTFRGLTLPSRLSAGWFFGSERFAEGEFFRVTLETVAPAG